MPLTEDSPIEKALAKIIGAPSAKSGTDESNFQVAPKSSYTPGFLGDTGGTTDVSVGQTPVAAYNAPVTAPTQSALTSNTLPVAATATPAASTAAAATPAASTAAPAAAPQQMISRADLYELQKQNQMETYDRKKAEQIASLRAAGMTDQQLGGALKPTNWGNAAQPANWGKPGSYSYDYMHTSMVPNPYTSSGASGGTAASAPPPTDMNALAQWKKTHAWTQGPGGQIIAK